VKTPELNKHKKFMRLALLEAKKAKGKTEPNPTVGCVIVSNGKVISKAYHERFGGPHAEVIALKRAKKRADGALMYVTLEPCCYFGKTPPCADLIIKSGIKEVIVAMVDPNPLNNGKGLALLRENNIKVSSGILSKEARRQNIEFIKRVKRQRPLVSVKVAQSLDGKIATKKRDSKWISSPKSRELVQDLRLRHDAIMVGVKTLLKDNPRLTVRNRNPQIGAQRLKRQPLKIIVDTGLKTPPNARIFSKASAGRVIIATSMDSSRSKEKVLREKGADVLRLSSDADGVDLKKLMKQLTLKGINSILVEGGGELIASLVAKGLADNFYFFIAPILIGGRDAITSVEGCGIKMVKDAIRLKEFKLKRVGRDLLIEA